MREATPNVVREKEEEGSLIGSERVKKIASSSDGTPNQGYFHSSSDRDRNRANSRVISDVTGQSPDFVYTSEERDEIFRQKSTANLDRRKTTNPCERCLV